MNQKEVAMTLYKQLSLLWMDVSRRFSKAMYVPSETGSHDMGAHYMGDMASSYVEYKNFPEAARSPLRRLQVGSKA
jgi:hypothetical protein